MVIFGAKALGRPRSTIFPIRQRQWHLKPIFFHSDMSFGPSWGGEGFLLQNFLIVGWTDFGHFFLHTCAHAQGKPITSSRFQVVNILSFTEYDSSGKIPPIVTLGLQCLACRRRSNRFIQDNTHESHGSPSYNLSHHHDSNENATRGPRHNPRA